jgi:hypothetical protein
VFYGSSVPDNKAIPAVQYLMSADGGDVKLKLFVLEGTDYVYPRTSNKIIRAFLKSRASPTRTSSRPTRHSASRTGRPRTPKSRRSVPRAKKPSSQPSAATLTCRSIRSWAIKA